MKAFLKPYFICFVAALFFHYELIQFHMMNALSSFLIEEFTLNATEFSFLCTTYLMADVLFLIPAGMIIDAFSVRKALLGALSLCLIGTVGFSFAGGFRSACFFHFLSGIGNAFSLLPCLVLISRWIPQKRQASFMSFAVTIGMLGGVVGQTPFSYLLHFYSWRHLLLLDAGVGVFLLALIYFFVEEGARKEIRLEPFEELSYKVKKAILSTKAVMGGLYTGLMNLPLMLLGAVWGSLFLSQIHSVQPIQASFVASCICLGTMVGSSLYGVLADWKGRRDLCMMAGAALSFCTMVPLFLYVQLPYLALVLLFFLLGLFSSSQVLSYPEISESSPPSLVGTSMGVAAVIIMGLPMLFQPLSGLLLDLYWEGYQNGIGRIYPFGGYQAAFSLFPLGFLASFMIAYKMKQEAKVAQ